MAGIYIHIPFCTTRCDYCDFYSTTELNHRAKLHTALLREMEQQRGYLGAEPLRTIYIGGGTPTLYSATELGQLIDSAKSLWNATQLDEVTVEANPDDLSQEYLEELKRMGVNRLSIGIQSFIDRDLKFMNRRHSAQMAIESVGMARRAGFDNITIDLIYGLPLMSDSEWRSNIEIALELDVEHISAYHLTIERGTVLWHRASDGEFEPLDELRSESEYRELHRTLTTAGYEHYELSNFAREGHRARHNSSYWSGDHYLGIGPSAHSYNGVERRLCRPSLGEYIAWGASYESEILTPVDLYNEYIMTSLRRIEGVSVGELSQRFGSKRTELFLDEIERYLKSGAIRQREDRYSIDAEKLLISDSIISHLFVVE